MIWKIATTIAILSYVAGYISSHFETNIPRVYNKWTYITIGCMVSFLVSAPIAAIAFVWWVL